MKKIFKQNFELILKLMHIDIMYTYVHLFLAIFTTVILLDSEVAS